MAVRVWDLEKRSCKSVLHGHRGYVLAIASDFPRFRIVTTSADYTIRLWSVENMHAEGDPMVGHVQKVTCIFTNTLGDDLDEEEKEGKNRSGSQLQVFKDQSRSHKNRRSLV